MIKLLITNGHLNVGGVEKSIVNLLNALDYSKIDVDLLLCEDLGDYEQFIPKNVNIIYWDMKPTYGSFFSVAKKAFKLKDIKLFLTKIILSLSNKVNLSFLKLLRIFHIATKTYDYAIAYKIGFPADFVSFAVKAKGKSVWWHTGSFDDNYPVKQWAKTFKNMDHIVCVSESSKAMMKKHFPQMRKKMLVIPNMIDQDEIEMKAKEYNPFPSNSTNKKILVSVGRLSPEKHMKDAVYVAKQLVECGHVDFVWYLVGDGPEYNEIKKLISEFCLEDFIQLTGNQNNPYTYIYHSDIFVHPSYVESQGIAVLEAFSLGKLCVVVKSDGTEEYVQDHINALQAEQSVESLTNCIMEAFTMHENRAIQANCKKTALQFAPRNITHKIYELIDLK